MIQENANTSNSNNYPKPNNNTNNNNNNSNNNPTSSNNNNLNTANPSKELECPMCHQLFEDPRLLYCAHSMCFNCCVLDSGKVECPTCHKLTHVKALIELPPNYLLRKALNETTKPRRPHDRRYEGREIGYEVAKLFYKLPFGEDVRETAEQTLTKIMAETGFMHIEAMEGMDALEKAIIEMEKTYAAISQDVQRQFQALIAAAVIKRDQIMTQLTDAKSSAMTKMQTDYEVNKKRKIELAPFLHLGDRINKWEDNMEFMQMFGILDKFYTMNQQQNPHNEQSQQGQPNQQYSRDIVALIFRWDVVPVSLLPSLANVRATIATPKIKLEKPTIKLEKIKQEYEGDDPQSRWKKRRST